MPTLASTPYYDNEIEIRDIETGHLKKFGFVFRIYIDKDIVISKDSDVVINKHVVSGRFFGGIGNTIRAKKGDTLSMIIDTFLSIGDEEEEVEERE